MFEDFFNTHPALDVHKTSRNFILLTKMSTQSRSRLWITTIGAIFLLFDLLQKSEPFFSRFFYPWASTHPTPQYRLKHLIKWTREFFFQSDAAKKAEYDKATQLAVNDLSLIAQKLGIRRSLHRVFAGEGEYETQIAKARRLVKSEMDEVLQKIQARYGSAQ
jgi:hypothetical protein